jgi:hypothetical protein
MWPDLAFRAGVPHFRWMDWVALGHVISHYLPGGDTAWLGVALLAGAGYTLLLARWLAARQDPARGGRRAVGGVAGLLPRRR